jgi:hypothetical protein
MGAQMNPDEEEHRLLPLAQAQMDPATRATVRADIAAGHFRDALRVLRAEIAQVKAEDEETGGGGPVG